MNGAIEVNVDILVNLTHNHKHNNDKIDWMNRRERMIVRDKYDFCPLLVILTRFAGFGGTG